MKVAIVFNRESKRVINLFGMPNQERIGRKSIERIITALKSGGHQVEEFEGDKDLVDNLENFMPQVIKGEKPGMVFNVSYGIQGQARYTHIPSILEMLGIPYVGSGPLAHSLSLDKVVSKMIFMQKGIPTPEFFVLESINEDIPAFKFPAIVKPKNEAVSLGIEIVKDMEELKKVAGFIFEKFKQPVLVEQYIEGREVNIGLLGNSPTEVFQPCEIIFGEEGPRIYTYVDKTERSGRSISWQCPADIGEELTEEVQRVALKAFKSLGCFDCARIDIRLDNNNRPYVLEVNSLPSLGEHGSYTIAAEQYGLNFNALVNRLVQIAYQRYFGITEKPKSKRGSRKLISISDYVVRNRDDITKNVQKWCRYSSRTSDSFGISAILAELARIMSDLGLSIVPEYTDDPFVWTWQTRAGLKNGIIVMANVDVPFKENEYKVAFKRDPEWIYGEGIGTSRGPLAMLEFTLKALKNVKSLDSRKIGVVLYADEGKGAQYSQNTIRKVAGEASRVIILRPTAVENSLIIDRRGQRIYNLIAETDPVRIERQKIHDDLISSIASLVKEIRDICKPYTRTSLAMVENETQAYEMHLPHYASAILVLNYANTVSANKIEKKIFEIIGEKRKSYTIIKGAERPPLYNRAINRSFAQEIIDLAKENDLTITTQSSALPSVAGLVPVQIPVICGMGPVARDLYTHSEAINSLGLIQRSLVLCNYLAGFNSGK